MYIIEFIEALLETTVGVMAAAAEEPWIRRDLLMAMGVENSAALEAELLSLQHPLAAVPGIEAASAAGADVVRWLAATNAAWSALEGMSAFGPGEAPALATALGTTGLQSVFPVGYHAAIALGFVVPFRPAARPTLEIYDTIDRQAMSAFLSAPRAYLAARLPSLDLSSEESIEASMRAFVQTWGRVLSAIGVVWTSGFEASGLGVPDEAFLRRMLIFQIWGNGEETEAAGIAVSGVPNGAGQGGLVVAPFGTLAVTTDRGAWTISTAGQVHVGGLQFGGDAGFRVVDGGPAPELRVVAERLDGEVILGSAGGASVRLRGVTISAMLGVSVDGLLWSLAGDVSDMRVVVAADEGDGFLRAVLGDRRLEATMSLGVVLDPEGGVRFRGSGGLSTETAARVAVGPLELSRFVTAIEATPERVGVAVTCDLAVQLGPVRMVLVGLGAEVAVRIAPSTSSGEPWLRHGFKAPDGAGLAIEAGAVSGVGVLNRVGRVYTGALALDVRGLTLTAYGVLDATGPGYSLAAVVATDLAPIPLGLGFILDGVGGMVGIHRRVDAEALRVALRGPGMGDIFFPADPIAQAARLTADLARFFPAASGRHVFGPAVRLRWGTPTLLRATLAVLLEAPSPLRLVILGSVTAALPTEEHAIITLGADIVGEVDFADKRVAIDASLRPDSRVAGFPITGDLAFRMRWGDSPSFALAIGGFHSQFRRPPGFPELRKIQIPIGSGDDPRLDVTGFLALTSNTAQVGSDIELYASAGPLNIRGTLGYETLITFSPFSLQADLWGGVTLRRGNRVLAGIHFDGHISGPRPWRVDGKATLSLWFVDLSVPVHVSFGGGAPVSLPSQDIWPLLRAAVEQRESWSTALPAGRPTIVTAPPAGENNPPLRIDPGAAPAMRQKIVPLDRRVTRFAQAVPAGANEFRVTELRLGPMIVPTAPATDWFAPAQFEDLTEADKLSRPGFERMTAGATAGDAARGGPALTKTLEYETIVWAEGRRQGGAPHRPTHDEQMAGTALGSVAQSPTFTPPSPPPLFTHAEETYVIASATDLRPRLDLIGHVTRGQAELALRAHLATASADAASFLVVPSHELAA